MYIDWCIVYTPDKIFTKSFTFFLKKTNLRINLLLFVF